MSAFFISFDIIAVCLIIVMIIVQFNLLSKSYISKLYRFCGQFMVFFVIVCFIVCIIALSMDSQTNPLVYVILYICCYDLWYIAADILDCDGMNVTSTRIYAFGFNFAVGFVLAFCACVYRYTTTQYTWSPDNTVEWTFLLLDEFFCFEYMLIFLVMTAWSTIRINKIRYNIIGHEQCYYLSKHVFNLLCIELWAKCIGNRNCLNSETARKRNSRIKSSCDRKFYDCCACGCICSQHEYTRSDINDIESKSNGNCFSKTMRILSIGLITTAGVFVVQRAYSLYIFWRAFVLVLDVNSDRKQFLKRRNKVNCEHHETTCSDR